MKNITVLLSPSQLPFYDLEGKTVVTIDVLRATSTITTALAEFTDIIYPTDNVESALELKKKHNAFVAGERNGEKIKEFDFGNSPIIFKETQNKTQKPLVITTTNGTKILKHSEKAKEVICASFLNLNSVINYLESKKDIVIYCAGWKDRINVEDSVLAGAICNYLSDKEYKNDACLMAESLFLQHKFDLYKLFTQTDHFKRLDKLGNESDLKFCAQQSIYDIIPIYKDGIIRT